MKLVLVTIACSISLWGCAAMDNKVSLGDLPQPPQQFVVDRTQPDNYPGFLGGEGNDLSCRFGIHHESANEFSPPKAQLFSALMAKSLPSITSHKVQLERFDVYYNHRLRALHVVGSGGVGGAVGAAIQATNEQAAHQNISVFTVDKLLIDAEPEVNRHPGENQVGCDNRHEGEYYPSEISGGHDVVVTWLKFTVDNKPYYFKTFYQFQPDGKDQIAAGIRDAIQMSIHGIAPRIQL